MFARLFTSHGCAEPRPCLSSASATTKVFPRATALTATSRTEIFCHEHEKHLRLRARRKSSETSTTKIFTRARILHASHGSSFAVAHNGIRLMGLALPAPVVPSVPYFCPNPSEQVVFFIGSAARSRCLPMLALKHFQKRAAGRVGRGRSPRVAGPRAPPCMKTCGAAPSACRLQRGGGRAAARCWWAMGFF
jgi:hypothetical protein